MRVLLIIALAIGAATLPTPLDVACIVALAGWHLWDMWTRQNALARVAQGVQERLDAELQAAIDAARAPVSTD